MGCHFLSSILDILNGPSSVIFLLATVNMLCSINHLHNSLQLRLCCASNLAIQYYNYFPLASDD